MLHGKLPVPRAARLPLRGRERRAQVTAEGVTGGDDGEALPRREALRAHLCSTRTLQRATVVQTVQRSGLERGREDAGVCTR